MSADYLNDPIPVPDVYWSSDGNSIMHDGERYVLESAADEEANDDLDTIQHFRHRLDQIKEEVKQIRDDMIACDQPPFDESPMRMALRGFRDRLSAALASE